MSARQRLFLLRLTLALLASAGPSSAWGQEPDTLAVPDTLPVTEEAPQSESAATEAVPRRITPRGAFIRSGLIPGWGHAKAGALTRGAFYFTAEAASVFMIFKTQTRISQTEARLELREDVIRERLIAGGETDPNRIESALIEDPQVEDLRTLRETRLDQREDWLALGIFLMLIGGVDAYVSAHLAEFPTAVVIEPTPSGGMEVGLSVSVGGL